MSRHRPFVRAQELGGVEPHGFGMIRVHMRDRARLGFDQIVRAGDIRHHVGGPQIGGAGKAAIEMGGHRVEPPEREIGEAGVKLRFRMAGEEAAPQPRLRPDRRARSGTKLPSSVRRG